MDERLLDAATLSYMTVFLFVFGGILITVPRRRNLLDAALTGLVLMLAVSYLRSLLGLFFPDVFDTVIAKNTVRVIAMGTVTVCVLSLWRELHGLSISGALRRMHWVRR